MNPLLAFLPILASVLGCSSQPKVKFIADMQNTCDYRINIKVINYGNYEKNDQAINRALNPNERASILNLICLDTHSFFINSKPANEKLKTCFIKQNYELTISANNHEISFDKERLLDILANSKYIKTGSGGYYWTIKDPSLCPKPQDTAQ